MRLSPPLPHRYPSSPSSANRYVSFITGIYFVLFGSSLKVLLTKRKTISAACTLIALAGIFGVLISWVSLSDDDPEGEDLR